MTERFTETISTGIVTDNKTGIEYICEMRIDYDFLNLVNTVAEENEQLQKKNDNLVHMIARVQYRADSIKDENEKLKKILGFLRNDNATDILNVLNSQENQIWELKKENEQLKHECNYLQNRLDDFVNIQNENEQLKKDCSNLIDDNTEYVAEINQMHKENEQLKKELESFKPIIFESDGKPVTLYKKGDVE